MGEAGSDARALQVVQITDTHLFAQANGTLLGLNTRYCLQEIMALLARSRAPDLIVASGDLTHDGSPQAYQAVRDCLVAAGAPVFCLPGNHDEGTALRACMNRDGFFTVRSHCDGGWQQVFLDSTIPGDEGGHLAAQELQELDTTLGAYPRLPALVWLHHQPVPIGSRWLDTMAVDNPEPFFDIIDRHPQVRAIVWGHVHQVFDRTRNGVRLLATPSTSIQFMPGSDEFSIEPCPPGYRWFELHPDGAFDTGIQRLERIPGTIDAGARGY